MSIVTVHATRLPQVSTESNCTLPMVICSINSCVMAQITERMLTVARSTTDPAFSLKCWKLRVPSFGSDRVGVRLSPFGTFNDMQDSDPLALFSRVISRLGAQKIAYVHLIEARTRGNQGERQTVRSKAPGAAPTAALFRPWFPGVLIGAGGL